MPKAKTPSSQEVVVANSTSTITTPLFSSRNVSPAASITTYENGTTETNAASSSSVLWFPSGKVPSSQTHTPLFSCPPSESGTTANFSTTSSYPPPPITVTASSSSASYMQTRSSKIATPLIEHLGGQTAVPIDKKILFAKLFDHLNNNNHSNHSQRHQQSSSPPLHSYFLRNRKQESPPTSLRHIFEQGSP